MGATVRGHGNVSTTKMSADRLGGRRGWVGPDRSTLDLSPVSDNIFESKRFLHFLHTRIRHHPSHNGIVNMPEPNLIKLVMPEATIESRAVCVGWLRAGIFCALKRGYTVVGYTADREERISYALTTISFPSHSAKYSLMLNKPWKLPYRSSHCRLSIRVMTGLTSKMARKYSSDRPQTWQEGCFG